MNHLRETWIEEFELFLQSSFELCSNFVQTFLQKKFELLFEELQTFSNRAKKKNVLEFIRFLPNFPIFQKNELSQRSYQHHVQTGGDRVIVIGRMEFFQQGLQVHDPKALKAFGGASRQPAGGCMRSHLAAGETRYTAEKVLACGVLEMITGWVQIDRPKFICGLSAKFILF
jgi:hypothetical protein